MNKKSVVAKKVSTQCTTIQIKPTSTEAVKVTPLQLIALHLKQLLPLQAQPHPKASYLLCQPPPVVIAQSVEVF